jgi:hypothetical protein
MERPTIYKESLNPFTSLRAPSFYASTSVSPSASNRPITSTTDAGRGEDGQAGMESEQGPLLQERQRFDPRFFL